MDLKRGISGFVVIWLIHLFVLSSPGIVSSGKLLHTVHFDLNHLSMQQKENYVKLVLCGESRFIRGDVDGGGSLTIGDGLQCSRCQFVPGWQDSIPLPCCSAPGDCGWDPTLDELGCDEHTGCGDRKRGGYHD